MPRAKGQPNKISRRARAEAAGQGLLPHEWLLKVTRGEPVEQKEHEPVLDASGVPKLDKYNKPVMMLVTRDYYATFSERLDAAKSAAPYYAPRLAAQQLNLGEDMTAKIVDLMKMFGGKLPT